MNKELESARDDLAFMRGLVSERGQFQATAGELFLWAGLLYGLQCVGNFLAIVGVVSLPPIGHLVLGFGPTLVFIGVLCVVIWRARKEKQIAGVASRAMNAVFQGAGLANLVLALVFAYGAYKAQSLTVWLYHPIVVCMFQGVAWYVTWAIRRRAWLGFVALGWFATTVALGFLIDNTPVFLLVLGVALFVLMGATGYAMMRTGKASA
jgi:hypothetical protein